MARPSIQSDKSFQDLVEVNDYNGILDDIRYIFGEARSGSQEIIEFGYPIRIYNLTTAQRNALSPRPRGTIVYDTTEHRLYISVFGTSEWRLLPFFNQYILDNENWYGTGSITGRAIANGTITPDKLSASAGGDSGIVNAIILGR